MKLHLLVCLLLLSSGCVTPTMWGWSGREPSHPAVEVSDLRIGAKTVTVTVRYSCDALETLQLPGNPVVLFVQGRQGLPVTVAASERLVHAQAVPKERALEWAAGAPKKTRPYLLGIHTDEPNTVYVAVPKHFKDRETVVEWKPLDRYPFGGTKWPVFRGCPEHAQGTVLARVLLVPCTAIADTVIVTGIVAGAVTYGALAVASLGLLVVLHLN